MKNIDHTTKVYWLYDSLMYYLSKFCTYIYTAVKYYICNHSLHSKYQYFW